jgi:hypothetical protein
LAETGLFQGNGANVAVILTSLRDDVKDDAPEDVRSGYSPGEQVMPLYSLQAIRDRNRDNQVATITALQISRLLADRPIRGLS